MSEEHTQKEMTRLDYALQCAKALEQKGYEVEPVSIGNLQSGVDVVAKKYGITYAIRCSYDPDSPVEEDVVKQAAAGRKEYHCDAAVVMTDSTFTDAAMELAEANDVILWPNERVEKKDSDSREYRKPESTIRSRNNLTSSQKRKRSPASRRTLIWLIIVVVALVLLLIILYRIPSMRGHNILEGIILRLLTGRNG